MAWLGLWFHDLREFEGSMGFTPDSLAFLAILAIPAVSASAQPSGRWPSAVLFILGFVQLVGGVVSVVPLPILPFAPAQTVAHYVAHAAYAAAQLPLLLVTWRTAFGRRTEPPGEVEASLR